MDMVDLSEEETDSDQLLRGIQAIILLDNLIPSLRERSQTGLKVVDLLKSAVQFRRQDPEGCDIQKIVMCSRFLPPSLIPSSDPSEPQQMLSFVGELLFSKVFYLLTQSLPSSSLPSHWRIFEGNLFNKH